ncbi:flippase [Metabacillus niabensis]|uniref:O-antigen/teichoic acid export membrane protein n=1 Tax=Metabacillus niabensis TaxID=324854 RepID=A0ABT9Z3H2_9BACI|nr:flippase [Metabacillus niabensis]MDQ0226814.1 O-antigen/teichoic acid export membrane protein [Metabacillus niabensis]
MGIKKASNNLKNSNLSKGNFSKVINNASWLISDKVFTMFIGVFVTAVIARYFGPEQYGQFNYAWAFASLFISISTLGLETLAVKSIVDKKVDEGVVLCTSLVIRVIGGTLLTLIASIIIRIIDPGDSTIHLLVLIISFTMIVKSVEVIEYWIQAHQKAKISSLIRMIVYVLIALFKILLVVLGGSLIHYALIYIVEAAIISGALVIAFFKKREEKTSWKFNFSYAKEILSQSWYLVLSGLMVSLYMRVDQVMLGSMMSTKEEVGIYSAAVRIAEMWFFVPMAIITSFKPVIMKNKNINPEKYLNSLQLLYSIIAWTGIVFGIVILFMSKIIVNILYGEDFIEAASILSISVWGGTFALLGSARSVWLVTEGLQKYSLLYTSAGMILNVILNLILIPKMGAYGAAIATLAAQIFANVFVLYFFSKTKISTYMIIKAFSIPKLIRSIKAVRQGRL